LQLNRKSLKKMFPNLAEELQADENRVAVNSVRTDSQTAERVVGEGYVHYSPDVIDFLRRCDTRKQAEEIIEYLAKKGEITGEYARRLRKQLMQKGVRSFGTKKEDNYYLKHGEL
jgi:hypothetical protein